jgi:hypothetical protein
MHILLSSLAMSKNRSRKPAPGGNPPRKEEGLFKRAAKNFLALLAINCQTSLERGRAAAQLLAENVL